MNDNPQISQASLLYNPFEPRNGDRYLKKLEASDRIEIWPMQCNESNLGRAISFTNQHLLNQVERTPENVQSIVLHCAKNNFKGSQPRWVIKFEDLQNQPSLRAALSNEALQSYSPQIVRGREEAAIAAAKNTGVLVPRFLQNLFTNNK